MATALKNLLLREVSLVDRGANQHSKVALFKRADATITPQREDNMSKTAEEIALEKKALDDAVAAAVAKAVEPHAATVAKLQRENALLKMSDMHKRYMDDMKMTDVQRDAFVAKSEADRETQVRADPVEKALPAHVQKALDDAAKNDVLLKGLLEKQAVADFEKRAEAMGLPKEMGETLRKSYSGDAASIVKMEQVIKGLRAQSDMSKLFSEFGTTNGVEKNMTANEQLQKQADDYLAEQTKVGKRISAAQAFAKVYELPANAELRELAKQEDLAKRRSAA